MEIYYSELCRIGGDVEENVQKLLAYGADHIELMLDGKGWNEFHTREEAICAALLRLSAAYSVHTPVWDINLTSENDAARKAAMEAYRQSIAFAARLGARHVVLHPGFCYSEAFDKATARSRAAESMEALCAWNQTYGRLLLVENVGNARTSIYTQKEYTDFILGLGKNAGGIVDIGHAFLCGWDIPGLLQDLGDKAYAVHVHDNNGRVDAHLPMGEGIIPWDELLPVIIKHRPDMRVILEYDVGTSPEALRQGKEKLQAIKTGR